MCKCRDLEGIELALCLAPPPGEYEVDIKVGRDKSVIINSEGVYLRQLITDETLPFINTIQRPLPAERALEIAGISIEDLTCKIVKQLNAASKSGSITSKKKIEECKNIISIIENKCNSK